MYVYGVKTYLFILSGFLLLILGITIHGELPYVCYYASGEKISISKNVNYFKDYPSLKTAYYKNGNVISTGFNGSFATMTGKWKYYYENGQLAMEINYKEKQSKDWKGLFPETLSRKCWNENGNEIKCSINLFADLYGKEYGFGGSECGKKILF